MKQKDKELLLKDLTARMLYGVCVHIIYKEGEPCYGKLTPRDIQWFIDSKIENIKPYLRPMSSMTEEEAKELLFVRLASRYGESCAYIKNFIKLNEVSFQEKSPYEGSIAVWFSFKNKIHDANQIR
jgi:hypothetical protein